MCILHMNARTHHKESCGIFYAHHCVNKLTCELKGNKFVKSFVFLKHSKCKHAPLCALVHE